MTAAPDHRDSSAPAPQPAGSAPSAAATAADGYPTRPLTPATSAPVRSTLAPQPAGSAPSAAAADTDGYATRPQTPAPPAQAGSALSAAAANTDGYAARSHTPAPPAPARSAPTAKATDANRDAMRTHIPATTAPSKRDAARGHGPALAERDHLRIQVPSPRGSNRRQFFHLAAAGLPALRAAEPVFRFALIGDRTGTATPQIYSRVWREVSLLGPDLAISIGDTIQGGNDATAVKEWRELDDVWRRYRRFPTYFVPGNHDIWSAESKRLFEIEAGHPAAHSFVHDGALFVILDNSLTDALPPGQLEYLERTLARHRDLRPKFVFCHRPSWLLDARVGNRNFGLHTLARKYGVDSVISGHGHQLVHLELDGVRYLEIGSSGGSIERGLKLGQGFKEGWFYHWIWVQVREGKVEMTVKEATGQGRMFRLNDWGPTGPKFDPGDPALLDTPRL